MKRRSATMILPLVALLLATTVEIPAASTPSPVLRQSAVSAVPSAKIWDGHNAEFEAYIRDAPIDRIEEVPIGVTHPKRAFFPPGGIVASVAWKVLPPGRPSGYWESYKSEIAAYELDKLLGMGMVPVAVEKKWNRETAAAILWLSPIHPWKEMFDNFICNKDRNAGNLLVDDDWNLYLIDHSRAFIWDKDMAVKMEHIDREFWNKIQAVDQAQLTAAIGKWVDKDAIKAMLTRRERMTKEIDKLVAAKGEAEVFLK
jgi:hypothetical protein